MCSKISRRAFIYASGLATAGLALKTRANGPQSGTAKIKAIAFDAFPVFDPRPIFKKVHELFPEQAGQLVETWRIKQFDYQWLRLAGNQYKNFGDVTNDALRYAASASGVTLSDRDRQLIMDQYAAINTWPDALPALEKLRAENLQLCFLSNMTAAMLKQGLENAGATALFDHVISTDARATYKPSPAAYQMGPDVLGLRREEILFVPFAGWDMAGACWFGYPTFWVNRMNAPIEQLDVRPDGMGANLEDLVAFVRHYNRE